MSDGKYFECILIYSGLEIVVSKKKYFKSQDINLASLRASKIVLLKSVFYPKRYTAGNYESSRYSFWSPSTDSLTLYGSDFSGQ